MVCFHGRAIVRRPNMSGYSWSGHVPRVPWHAQGVTSCVMVSRTMSVGVPPRVIARTDACASPPPSSWLGHTLNTRSMQVAVSPGWEKDLPDVLSASLSRRAWTPTPAARAVPVPVSSLTTAAFPSCGPGRRSTMYRTATSVRRALSRLQSCADVQARRCACHPDRSYRYSVYRLAAVTFTSEPLVGCYLPTPRICSPSASGN